MNIDYLGEMEALVTEKSKRNANKQNIQEKKKNG